MMENTELAQIFEEIVDLLEVQGANPFLERYYRAAATTARDLDEPVYHDWRHATSPTLAGARFCKQPDRKRSTVACHYAKDA
jgi:hypothetical protein